MGYHNENFVDDTTFEFPRIGFWLIHILGAALLVFLGFRFALRHTPMPLTAYRWMKALMRH